MPPEPKVLQAQVLELIAGGDSERIRTFLLVLHPADIADLIEQAPPAAHHALFELVPDDVKPDVLAELEAHAEADVLESLSNAELSEIVEEMAPDDAADVLGDLPDVRARQVLELMEDEESEEVRQLLAYGEETAGGIMTTDVVAMQEDQTVDEALQAIAYLETDERFVYAYIVGPKGVLRGVVDVWELLREKDRRRPLADLARPDLVAATVDMDQEAVAQLFMKYDLPVLPVTDAAGVLVGRVTADDVIDVVEEEASEDIFRLAGSDDAELEHPSMFRSCLVRLPWLCVTLAGGLVTSFILRHFHAHISEVLILGAFVPVILAMGGNTGIQSSTLVVRGMAIGALEGQSTWRLLLREIGIGTIMGCLCGTAIGIGARAIIAGSGLDTALSAWHLAAVVGIALWSAMTFAAVFGALVPILLARCRADPAVASGPFVTITNDITALLIYFLVTVLLVSRFAEAS